MTISGAFSRTKRCAPALGAGAAILFALCSCDLPFSLGQPSTRALESGAADTLTAAKSFEITGSYTGNGAGATSAAGTASSGARATSPNDHWTIDLQVAQPDAEHVVVTGSDSKLEAIILGKDAYFRGNQFLAEHMGSDPLSQNLVKAAGNAWWKGSAGHVPRLPDFTDGSVFRSTFLGTSATQRIDHVAVDGIDAVELSGPRADVFIDAGAPHHVLRVHLKDGVVIDGTSNADLRYKSFDQDFQIAAPKDVIDFSNLSTLPPVYTVVSVDTSGCASPCVVSALLKNLGGLSGAQAPTTITFTMTDPASGRVVSTCRMQVRPDVGYNATTTVSCTFDSLSAQPANAAIVTATADNPGHA